MKRLSERAHSALLNADPLWYKDAVIYQLHIVLLRWQRRRRGDFGLLAKLDYPVDLGVDTVWLLPFYPSPRLDDGYDIADYRNVHPEYGTLSEARLSSMPRTRTASASSPNWSSTTPPTSTLVPALAQGQTRLGGPQLLCVVRRRPCLRRHAHHLLRHREVQLELGPGGRRLLLAPLLCAPARPELRQSARAQRGAVRHALLARHRRGRAAAGRGALPVEREGTSNENLPETHAIIRKIRAHLDARYPGRMLLAEANMWPEDAQQYFGIDGAGRGRQGRGMPHGLPLPLMPRMYMAIAREDRFPITDIMRQTPEVPVDCQWAIFLRNHDELTLEMVTSSERDYLWRSTRPSGAPASISASAGGWRR